MFRPYRNRSNWRMPFTPEQRQTALKANQYLSTGKPKDAAPLFASLAKNLEDSQHPRRAANFHAQAAHAYADSQNESSALDQARMALSLFIQYQMAERTPRFYANITRKMSQNGMASAAQTLQKEFQGLVGPIPAPSAPFHRDLHGSLPTACTQCGAPVRSDEIEWIDDQTVECGYCGALIKTI